MRHVWPLAVFALACSAERPPLPPDTGAPPRDAADAPDTAAADVASPPDAAAPLSVGEPCDGACPGGLRCETAMPGGYCTRTCRTGADDCPAGAACAAWTSAGAMCHRVCAARAECRTEDGYDCVRAPGLSARICAESLASPVGTRRDGSACFTAAGGAHPLPPLARRTFAGPNVPVSASRMLPSAAEGNVVFAPSGARLAAGFIGVAPSGGFLGVAHSTGDAWTSNGSVTDPALDATSDPVLVYGRDGVLHMAFLGFQRRVDGAVTATRVRVADSTDGGATWSPARQAEPEGFCGGGNDVCDKPWIVAGPDPRSAGAEVFHLVYLKSAGGALRLVTQRSGDNGRTWSAPVTLSDATLEGRAIDLNHAYLATGDDGALAASWFAWGGHEHGSTDNAVRFRRSADGGRSYEPLRTASRPTDAPVFGPVPVALDGATAHVVYATGLRGGAWDVVLATSVDGGATWRHRKVNDDPERCATHFLPALAVDRVTHAVHVVWMENRFGDGAVAYARCPGDPAAPCGANEQVSDQGFRLTTARDPGAWHGDYLGVTVTPAGDLWAACSDTRTGSPQMYVARGRAR